MVKVFTPNKNGKIEFTKNELEKLLDEVWKDGYNSNSNWYWRSPWYYGTYTTVDYNTSTTTNVTEDNITLTGTTINPNTISVKVGE